MHNSVYILETHNERVVVILCDKLKSAWIGLTAIIPTIMIGNKEIELPAIHMTNRFIGTCFIGPRATSHDRYNKISKELVRKPSPPKVTLRTKLFKRNHTLSIRDWSTALSFLDWSVALCFTQLNGIGRSWLLATAVLQNKIESQLYFNLCNSTGLQMVISIHAPWFSYNHYY